MTLAMVSGVDTLADLFRADERSLPEHIAEQLFGPVAGLRNIELSDLTLAALIRYVQAALPDAPRQYDLQALTYHIWCVSRCPNEAMAVLVAVVESRILQEQARRESGVLQAMPGVEAERLHRLHAALRRGRGPQDRDIALFGPLPSYFGWLDRVAMKYIAPGRSSHLLQHHLGLSAPEALLRDCPAAESLDPRRLSDGIAKLLERRHRLVRLTESIDAALVGDGVVPLRSIVRSAVHSFGRYLASDQCQGGDLGEPLEHAYRYLLRRARSVTTAGAQRASLKLVSCCEKTPRMAWWARCEPATFNSSATRGKAELLDLCESRDIRETLAGLFELARHHPHGPPRRGQLALFGLARVFTP